GGSGAGCDFGGSGAGCGCGGVGAGIALGTGGVGSGAMRGCSRTVARTFVFGAMVTRSTGTTGGDWSEISSLCENVKSVPTTMAPCNANDAAQPAGDRLSPASVALEILFLVPVVIIAGWCDIRDQADVGESCRTDERHHLHDAPVIDRSVAAHEDALIVTVGR